MTRRAVLAAATALVLVSGGAWGATRGGEASAADTGKAVTVKRGTVSITVGGIGRVSTLSEAARFAVGADTSGSSGTAASSAGLEAVFATASGHVSSLLVAVGDPVRAGQRIAVISDDGTARVALVQARSDLASARLDLEQKRVQDPARGLPPTGAEITMGRQAVKAAQDRLDRLAGAPLPADLSAARLELDRALAELEAEESAGKARPGALEAARQAVTTATARLATVGGSPDPTLVTAARLEVAKAQLDLEALLVQPIAPSAADVAAADAAIAAAQEKLAAAQAAGSATDIATAHAELARAQADRAALDRAPAAPSAAALAAGRLAVDAAKGRLDQLFNPPADVVAAARSELAKAQSDLTALRANGGAARTAAAESAVAAAQSRLDQLLRPPTETVSAARTEVSRAAADLAVLRQRGAPASATDLAIAGLRVDVAAQQVDLAREMAKRLVVRAPGSGTVTSMLSAEGAAVDPSTPLVRVQDLDNLVVSVNLTEFDVGKTQVGADARISADALGGRPYAGSVVDVALSGGDSGGVVTFPVIVSVGEAEDLRPGMSVSVRVVVARQTDVVRLPLDAIADRKGKKATVVVQTASGKLVERDVELGLVGPSYAEARAGLDAGDKVVIETGDEA
jgi:HlyD family secretion protein